MTEPLSRALLADLRRIVGPDAVISDPDRLLVYESDGLTAYRFPPRAVVLPTDTADVVQVLRRLATEGVPVVPRGAGTGLSGGALATGGAVVVGTARMNRILSLDAENRTARVQPGVVNAALSAAAAPLGLYYAPDPSSQTACTIGGNVAENSGGPHCLKYGVTSRYVTGLTAVLRDGEVLALGGAFRERPGYDFVGLLVGSEGCLALVTEVEVRLLPVPEEVRTLLAVFDDVADAGRAVTGIMAEGLLPAALEIVDRETIRAVEASVFAAGYPLDAGAVLVVEFDGIAAGLDSESERAAAACVAAGAREVRLAKEAAERAALWKGRKKAFGAMGRIAPDLLVQDATVPRTRLPDVLSRISEIARRHRLTVANVFHAGDGNLHPNLLFDRRDADELARVEAASREIMEVCVEAGGTITGEHGVGLDKRGYMGLVHSPDVLSAMAGVKAAFDPSGLLNPGKVLPDGVRPPELAGGARQAVETAPAAARSERAAEIRQAFEALLGSDAVEVGGEPWSRGETSPEPVLVLLPRSEEEVADCLRLSSDRGWRVLPAGAGTWLHAGRPPGDAVLSVLRMDRIVQYEPADLTLTAGAGLSLDEVERVTVREGQWLPLDPPGSGSATLGAVLATGRAGGLASAYGGPRDLVLGLRMVAGDGRILRLGGRVVKNVAGFDLVRLATGSGGSLGVITEATFRLFPQPRRRVSLVWRAPRLEALVGQAREVARAPFVPAAAELLEGPGVEPALPAGEAALVVRLAGTPERVEREAVLLEERLGPAAETLEGADGDALVHAVRGVWDGAALALALALPPASLGELVGCARSLAGEPSASEGTAASVRSFSADVLAGALRLALRPTSERGDAVVDVVGRIPGVRRDLESREGSLVVLHGPAVASTEVSARRERGGVSRLAAGIRAQFDPAGTLSPGRWVLRDGE